MRPNNKIPFKYRGKDRENLARAIYEVIPEFSPSHSTPRTGIGYKLVGTILKVITEALRRGEKVQIQGLGTFHIKTLNPRVNVINKYFQSGSDQVERPSTKHIRTWRLLPPRQRVIFTPSKSLTHDKDSKDEHKPED